MGRQSRASSRLFETGWFKHGQDLQNAQATRAGRRRRDDGVTVVGANKGPALQSLVLPEVLESDQPTVGLHVGSNKMGRFSFIEIPGTRIHEALERVSQFGLPKYFARFIATAVSEKDALGIRELA